MRASRPVEDAPPCSVSRPRARAGAGERARRTVGLFVCVCVCAGVCVCVCVCVCVWFHRYVVVDGRSNWLVGFLLVGAYLMVAAAGAAADGCSRNRGEGASGGAEQRARVVLLRAGVTARELDRIYAPPHTSRHAPPRRAPAARTGAAPDGVRARRRPRAARAAARPRITRPRHCPGAVRTAVSNCRPDGCPVIAYYYSPDAVPGPRRPGAARPCPSCVGASPSRARSLCLCRRGASHRSVGISASENNLINSKS